MHQKPRDVTVPSPRRLPSMTRWSDSSNCPARWLLYGPRRPGKVDHEASSDAVSRESKSVATRFSTDDHLAAQRAAGALPQAARTVAGRTKAAVAMLDNLEPAATPGEALAALARSRRARAGIEHAEGALMQLLVECGASHRSLAAALGIGRSTVDRLIAQARADQEARNG